MSSVRSIIQQLAPRQSFQLKRIWLLLFVVALYVLLCITVQLRLWTGFDLAVTVFLDRQVPRLLDRSLSAFSLIGSAEVTGLFVLAYAFFFCPKESRLWLVVLFALIALFESIGKYIIFQPSPPDIFYHNVPLLSLPTGSIKTPFSFPSGHSARSVFVGVLLISWVLRSRIGTRGKQAMLVLVAVSEIVMLITRVSLGTHWSTDVVGGALLGTALALPWLYSLKPALVPFPYRIPLQPGPRGDGQC